MEKERKYCKCKAVLISNDIAGKCSKCGFKILSIKEMIALDKQNN